MTNIVPLKACVKYNPPTLLLIYSRNDKQQYKKFQIALLGTSNEIAKKLAAEYPAYLSEKHITEAQLCNLIERIYAHQPSPQLNSNNKDDDGGGVVGGGESIKHEEDPVFKSNQITPEQPAFVYDKRVEFESELANDWDDDDDDDDDAFDQEDNIMF